MPIVLVNSPIRRFRQYGLMACMVYFVLAFLLSAAPASALTRHDVKLMVIEEAMNSRVPPSLALAVARVESSFNPSAKSHMGARGVMQIMPRTARVAFGVDPKELWNARLNIQLGIGYLEDLIDRYGGRWDLALSHYNAGSVSGTPPDARPLPVTRKYVRTVLRWHRRFAQHAGNWKVGKKPSDGWVPAETRIAASHPEAVSRKITVVHRTKRERTWAKPRKSGHLRIMRRMSRRSLDDFGEGFAERLAKARKKLDDFGTIVIWTDG